MNLVPLARLCAWPFLLALVGCAPEAVELVRFGSDAAQGSDGDAQSELSLDAEAEVDPLFDAGTSNELDARVQPPLGELDSGLALRGCSRNEDCSERDYCSLPSCTAKRGTCMASQTVCGSNLSPVCGCDGNQYFNDCLRKKQKVSADLSCTLLRPCSGPGTCPPFFFCSQLYTDRCRSGPADRTCWVTPTCPPNVFGGEQFVACDATGTTGDTCVSACAAIQSQLPFAQVRSCGPPRGTGGPSGPDFM